MHSPDALKMPARVLVKFALGAIYGVGDGLGPSEGDGIGVGFGIGVGAGVGVDKFGLGVDSMKI
ncbi:MAG: hypothetical protein DME43_15805 [Verrucomicrobia bacterium]|nr:MAG: hypothetical protein DME43_15805 [Verrucomicrobiota bacterium]PYK71602.1 MAG: hypothetical protein DME44_07385 [Verrucomicrobiota bacterium]